MPSAMCPREQPPPEQGQDIPGREEAGPQLPRLLVRIPDVALGTSLVLWGRSRSVLTARPAGRLSRLQVAHQRWRRLRPGRLMAFLRPSPAPCASLSGGSAALGPRPAPRSGAVGRPQG